MSVGVGVQNIGWVAAGFALGYLGYKYVAKRKAA